MNPVSHNIDQQDRVMSAMHIPGVNNCFLIAFKAHSRGGNTCLLIADLTKNPMAVDPSPCEASTAEPTAIIFNKWS